MKSLTLIFAIMFAFNAQAGVKCKLKVGNTPSIQTTQNDHNGMLSTLDTTYGDYSLSAQISNIIGDKIDGIAILKITVSSKSGLQMTTDASLAPHAFSQDGNGNYFLENSFKLGDVQVSLFCAQIETLNDLGTYEYNNF